MSENIKNKIKFIERKRQLIEEELKLLTEEEEFLQNDGKITNNQNIIYTKIIWKQKLETIEKENKALKRENKELYNQLIQQQKSIDNIMNQTAVFKKIINRVKEK